MGRIRCCGIAFITLCLLLVEAYDLAQNCGRRKVTNFLIANGTESKVGYWPWHAAIFHINRRSFVYQCGGTILAKNTVLTAAHCVMISDSIIIPERLVVHVGRNQLFAADNRAQEHDVFASIIDPRHSVRNVVHDIALIKLTTDITYTDFIQPVCLWNQGEDQNAIVGKWGTVIGYGIDKIDDPLDTLREARIPVVDGISCEQSYPNIFANQSPSTIFCGGNRDGIGACNGDSGGGLFFNYRSVWFIRGVVSFSKYNVNVERGIVCDLSENTVFTDVAKYLQWIELKNEPRVTTSLVQSCGKRKVANFFIVNGTESKDGYWPWHAALFHNEGRSSVYACGGTVLDKNTVLTAAHCVMTSNVMIERERLVVHVGRNQLTVASRRVQEHDVLNLIVHPDFNSNSIRHNIALIKLNTSITYNDYIQPICLWNRGENENTIDGKWGTVVGFGLDESGTLSDTLRAAKIPIVSDMNCIESNRNVFGYHLSSDMFCGGNRDGISACNGDSGGGLFFNYNDVWFIRGVVSAAKPRQNSYICDSTEYTIFTDVAKYLKWIEQPVGLVVTSSLAQSCGKRKVTNFLIKNGSEAKEGQWPWHAAIFHNDGRSFDYKCGGTILDQNTVLTAAHCVMTSSGLIARERLVVHVGRNRLRVANNRAQELSAFDLIPHPEYSVHSNPNDIALIKLATDITYTNFIQPICLWNQGESINAIVGTRGTVVGFGMDETNNISNSLREATIPVVKHITCIENNRNAFVSQLTSNMFCAGNGDGTEAANGDSGGGFFINYNDVWCIRGVVSFSTTLNDTKRYTVFTDVAKYLKWIKQNMRQTGVQRIVTENDVNHKIGLLPMSTCGANPYTFREESSKPIILGYPWMGLVECTKHDSSTVRLGEYDKNTTKDCATVDGRMVCSPPIQTLRIETMILHPDYNNQTHANDIALIRLRDRADTNFSNVMPICLPTTNEIRYQKSTHYILTSWLYGIKANLLQRSLRETMDSVDCHELIKKANGLLEITAEQICIKQQYGPECKLASSAAPLQLVQKVAGKSRYVLHGLFSYGPRRCRTPYPDVYTNVASYIDWILENINE